MYVHGGTPHSSVYTATKGAILTFAKTLSGELLPRGVRVNAVSAAPVDTPLFDKLGIPDAYREQAIREITATIPAGRFGQAVEIAKAVVYLASDESAWTVGTELVVDGGRMLNL
jgi:NAD(P)-dependent dehydrogenase (short-subunit alcohol dehydrogenase family)